MANPKLTVVIPTFNEGDIIETSLQRVCDALGDLRPYTQIIIADDGTDDLPHVIERCGEGFGFLDIIVLRNKKPLGKGVSIQRAFHVAEGEIVGFIDVDHSVDPAHIHEVIGNITSGSDICIAKRAGNRFKSDGSFLTSILATLFKIIHKNLLFGRGRGFSDTQCGFKFFKKEVAQDLYTDLVAPDGLADLEILLKAVKREYAITEVTVPRRNDREGKRKLSRIIVGEAVSLWKIFLKYKVGI